MFATELDQPATSQAAFGALVGISRQAVNNHVRNGVLRPGATYGEWLAAYVERLRSQCTDEALDLAQERAALAHAQWEAQEIRNAQTRAEWAPVGDIDNMLRRCFAVMSRGIAELPGQIDAACPTLPPAVRALIAKTAAGIRNELARAAGGSVKGEPPLV